MLTPRGSDDVTCKRLPVNMGLAAETVRATTARTKQRLWSILQQGHSGLVIQHTGYLCCCAGVTLDHCFYVHFAHSHLCCKTSQVPKPKHC